MSKHKQQSAILAGAFIAMTQFSGSMFPVISPTSIQVDLSKHITITQGSNLTTNLK